MNRFARIDSQKNPIFITQERFAQVTSNLFLRPQNAIGKKGGSVREPPIDSRPGASDCALELTLALPSLAPSSKFLSLLPRLPCHPCKNGTHSTSFCNTSLGARTHTEPPKTPQKKKRQREGEGLMEHLPFVCFKPHSQPKD